MDISTAIQPILTHLRPVANDFEFSGHRLYLVGGVVRDLLSGRLSDTVDLDLTTSARPALVRSILEKHATALWTQGERFGTIGARVDGRAVEITTHRSESYKSTTRKPEVEFGDSLEVDLSRRDFTINAMAVSLPDGVFFDPYDGRGALYNRRLVTPIDPVESFSDDPLRMLRAARFLPRFNLEPTPELCIAAKRLADRLSVVSRERVSAELDRLLETSRPQAGFDFLVEVAALGKIIPGLSSLSAEELDFSIRLASDGGSVAVRRAGLLYPLYRWGGAESVDEALKELRYSGEVQAVTLRLLSSVETVTKTDSSHQEVRRFVVESGLEVSQDEVGALYDASGFLPDLGALTTNVGSVGPIVSDGSFFRNLTELTCGGVLAYRPCLSGHDIIKASGVVEGPKIGSIKQYLREEWIKSGDYGRDVAVGLVERWSRDNS